VVDKIFTVGEQSLNGEVTLSGSKNATLAILAAALIAESGQHVLTNVPQISDVRIMTEILAGLGVHARFSGKNTLIVDATGMHSTRAPYELITKMRASFSVLGPILARFGKASVALPGGCDIGARPVDFHLKGLELMGAKIEVEHGFVEASAPDGLHGAKILFERSSVGATTHLMAAAALAKGTTQILNAAAEPDVVTCAGFINAMGGRIRGAGSKSIEIEGVPALHGAEFAMESDRIEAGTFAAAAAITRGDVYIRNAVEDHLVPVVLKLEEMGVLVLFDSAGMRVRASAPRLKCVNIEASPHPGFPTDLQPIFAAALSLAEGTSVITETIYERRFKYVDELARMGADTKTQGNAAVINGVERLSGAPVAGTDLRATAALVLAGLAAQGVSEISGVQYLDRGYEEFEAKLQALGGNVWRASQPAKESALLAAEGGSSVPIPQDASTTPITS
jgi:UDP-N-acetylglucosamine 1-carboxyvinyltransferase